MLLYLLLMTIVNTSQKFSIGDGKQLSVIGSSNVNVTNGQLEDVFHVERMPINLLSIYRACQKGFKFESWPDKYVLKISIKISK